MILMSFGFCGAGWKASQFEQHRADGLYTLRLLRVSLFLVDVFWLNGPASSTFMGVWHLTMKDWHWIESHEEIIRRKEWSMRAKVRARERPESEMYRELYREESARRAQIQRELDDAKRAIRTMLAIQSEAR